MAAHKACEQSDCWCSHSSTFRHLNICIYFTQIYKNFNPLTTEHVCWLTFKNVSQQTCSVVCCLLA